MDIDYKRLVAEAVLDEAHFIRAVFSAPLRGHATPWKRVVVRPVTIRGQQQVQFTYYDAAHSIDHNRIGPAAGAELAELLELHFRDIHVELTDRTHQVTIGRKGDVRLRSAETPAPASRALNHDRQKRLPLPVGNADRYLIAAGIMQENGQVRADQQDKFRQVNEFLRLLTQTIAKSEPRFQPRRIVDLGCGNAYLTLAAYHYFNDVLGEPVELCGVDVREQPIARNRQKAAELGWHGLTFEQATIAAFQPRQPPDLVLSLHACDTATDDAIARAVQWRSRYLFAVPCCHHELQQQLRAHHPPEFRPVFRDGVLGERFGDVLTDACRAQLLRIFGYRTDVVQFVSSEHTAKNLMIRAALVGRPADPAAVEEYVRLKAALGITPHLERLLAAELDALESGLRTP